jgi:hypothetical protein
LSIPRFHRNEIIELNNEEEKWISSSNLKTHNREVKWNMNTLKPMMKSMSL